MTNGLVIAFTKVELAWGFLGNMAPYKIKYEDKEWKTAEALFQALRFDDEEIREEIRKIKSPMGAKMFAKKHRNSRVVEPTSEQDLDLMRIVVKLKFDQHLELKRKLLNSGNHLIIEDVTNRKGGRHEFWGMRKVGNDWIGENMLGNILMELRDIYKGEVF